MTKYSFHENFATRKVEFHIDGVKIYESGEYLLTATYAQRTADLSEAKLFEMYREYKDEYERKKQERY